MKKAAFLLILFCLSSNVCFSQTSKSSAVSKVPAQAQAKLIAEISDADWTNLIAAVEAENWKKSASLAGDYLTKIKAENEKKQIARLRYILLYSLAGKLVEASFANKKTEEADARIELEKTANQFTGKEFFMPSREISNNCAGRLNYICRSNQQRDVLRVTATNNAGTAILSFDYVKLNENFSFLKNVGKQAILGGTLNKFEFNPNKSNVWIMRLFFENGSVNVVPDTRN